MERARCDGTKLCHYFIIVKDERFAIDRGRGGYSMRLYIYIYIITLIYIVTFIFWYIYIYICYENRH